MPQLSLPVARPRAHKGRLTAVDACGLRLATGSSAGGVKVWDVLELRAGAVNEVRGRRARRHRRLIRAR